MTPVSCSLGRSYRQCKPYMRSVWRISLHWKSSKQKKITTLGLSSPVQSWAPCFWLSKKLCITFGGFKSLNESANPFRYKCKCSYQLHWQMKMYLFKTYEVILSHISDLRWFFAERRTKKEEINKDIKANRSVGGKNRGLNKTIIWTKELLISSKNVKLNNKLY